MKKIDTDKAPEAIGPYSQAIMSGDLIFCSGQIPLDPSTGQLVVGGIKEQTARALANLEAVLAAAGASLASVTVTTVYLAHMSDFQAMNDVYAAKFATDPKPARVTVGVSELPKGALVEISCIASK